MSVDLATQIRDYAREVHLDERPLTLDEIKALEIRCNKCGGLVSVPVQRENPYPFNCPSCGEELTKGTMHAPSIVFVQLLKQLRNWGNIDKQDEAFQITFTLTSPQD